MTNETFYEYITNIFYPWCLRSGIEFPTLVFMDGHASHLNLALSNFCVQNSIELVSLLANLTQWTQPLDVGLFRSLKEASRAYQGCLKGILFDGGLFKGL